MRSNSMNLNRPLLAMATLATLLTACGDPQSAAPEAALVPAPAQAAQPPPDAAPISQISPIEVVGVASLSPPAGSPTPANSEPLLSAMPLAQPASSKMGVPVDLRYQIDGDAMAGQQVTVMMQNLGTVEHDFVIQDIPVEAMAAESEADGEGHTMPGMGTEMEPAVHMGAMAGMSDSVAFVPTKPGTYEFYCAVPGHREAGMVGSLMVRER